MAIMRRFMAKKQQKELPTAYTRLSGVEDDDKKCGCKVRKGYVPVMVGEEDGARERFLIPTRFMAHPAIVSLLESSANEFGYAQQGVLHIPRHPDCFREVLQSLPSNKF